jgi:hypothetical protein
MYGSGSSAHKAEADLLLMSAYFDSARSAAHRRNRLNAPYGIEA